VPRDVEGLTHADAGRNREAVPDIALANADERTVDAQDQGPTAGYPRPLDECAGRVPIPPHMNLEPQRAGSLRRHRLDRAAPIHAEDVGRPRLAGGARRLDLAARPAEASHPRRRHQDGAREPVVQHGDGEVPTRHVDEGPGTEGEALERLTVPANGHLVPRPSVDEVEDHARQAPPRSAPQILDRQVPYE
jgi:hypothetical protein